MKYGRQTSCSTPEKVTDNNLISLREAAKGFLISMRVANISRSYLDTLEATLALFATFAEDEGRPLVSDVTAGRIEEFLGYVQTRPRWFGQSSLSHCGSHAAQ